MTSHHIPCEQGTPEWRAARAGKITASVIGDLITSKRAPAFNATSRAIVNQLACERATGLIAPHFESYDMARGHELEPIAKHYYATARGILVCDCGFFTDGIVGASPDGLVGSDGMVEVKTRNQRYQFETILNGEVPAEYMPQIQMQLLVTGRAWCDFISFCDGLPLFVKRVFPDAEWFAAIDAAIAQHEDAIEASVTAFRFNSANMTPTEQIIDDAEITPSL